MVDYSKLKVTELKEELKKRGLPLTGLKAALVTRLTEADVNAQQIQTSEGAPQPPIAVRGAEDVKEGASIDAPVESRSEDVDAHATPTGATTDPNPRDADSTQRTTDGVGSEAVTRETSTAQAIVTANEVEHAEETNAMLAEISSKLPAEDPSTEPRTDVSLVGQILEKNAAPTIENNSVTQTETDSVIPPPTASKSEAAQTSVDTQSLSDQSSLNKEEVLEDTRKRKRRSQSPPLVVEAAQKRAKAEDGSPRVKLPEDLKMGSEGEGGPENYEREVLADKPAESAMDLASPSKEVALEETARKADHNEVTPAPMISDSSIKQSPSDTRFKNLFTAPLKRDASPLLQPAHEDTEDRVVTPAVHAATAAVYIRNFMRPLQPGNLKDHLAFLATPANSSPKPDVITNFYLDPIRTHCLAEFSSISAASRVRSALHSRVWPDERTRKPLWVDFVPEEKVTQWIEVQQSASGGRGQAAKRWEIVYEDEEGGTKAYLQEAGTAPRAAGTPSTRTEPGRGVVGAPSGPRASEREQHVRRAEVGPRPDGGKGFKALDDLFQSTAAKPKLYFLPVHEAVANRRLDKLAAGRGGGKGDEMRRFTFEDERVVDKGPEFGAGFRGGYRGRGGAYAGALSTRGGGGWRGDSWRDRR
ncbi:MAG: hypothetical protein LQ347_002615 [Umbilicaria vellea]|nr:MAG: hypothetical protein LQ347_002615 [Umbilicaria vellea]